MARVNVAPQSRVEDFGAYFSTLMEARGLTNMELSRLSGVENGSLSRWRRNLDTPSPISLRRVAPHLGVRYGDLLVAADLATPEELGMHGSPPPPGGPLPTALRKVVSLLLDPGVTEHDKSMLLVGIERTIELWDGMRKPPREPRMRRR